MQPLIVGVTPIGRKYELRLAEIAWRTLPYLHVRKNPFSRPLFIRKRRPNPMNQNGRQPLPRPPSPPSPPPSFFPANNCQRQVPPVTRQKLNAEAKRLLSFELTPNLPPLRPFQRLSIFLICPAKTSSSMARILFREISFTSPFPLPFSRYTKYRFELRNYTQQYDYVVGR